METQVTLTMQDQHQASVLQLLDSSRTSVGQAAQLLDCSERQVYRKLAAYRAIIDERKIEDRNVCFVGDDIIDIPVLRRVGFSAAVADAVPEVKEVVDYVTGQAGGKGAVREVCELLLKAQNKWEQVTEKYTLPRGSTRCT